MDRDEGSLILVATPIGNLGDLSPRAAESLKAADGWIVEDSRVSGKLAAHLGIKAPMQVLNDHTNPGRIQAYVQEIQEGKRIALLTDGGSPVISDPGALLVDACHDAGITVQAIPGPSAVPNALALSGFFGQRFVFFGFLGRKSGDIRKELDPYGDSPLTIILFESPFRVDSLLEAAFTSLGPRRYAICREMTKIYEQVYRNTLPNIPSEKECPRKGEVTIVIEGRRKNSVRA